MTDAYVPLTGPPTWQHAACRGEDPELWFPLGTQEPRRNPFGETAVDICGRCPLRGDPGPCLDWAHANGVIAGIWSGLNLDARANRRPRPQCGLDGCGNLVPRHRRQYCSTLCAREANYRATKARMAELRAERRRARRRSSTPVDEAVDMSV